MNQYTTNTNSKYIVHNHSSTDVDNSSAGSAGVADINTEESAGFDTVRMDFGVDFEF
jgi:hypothetical protein